VTKGFTIGGRYHDGSSSGGRRRQANGGPIESAALHGSVGELSHGDRSIGDARSHCRVVDAIAIEAFEMQAAPAAR